VQPDVALRTDEIVPDWSSRFDKILFPVVSRIKNTQVY